MGQTSHLVMENSLQHGQQETVEELISKTKTSSKSQRSPQKEQAFKNPSVGIDPAI